MKEIYHNLKNYMLTALLVYPRQLAEATATNSPEQIIPIHQHLPKPVSTKEPTSVG